MKQFLVLIIIILLGEGALLAQNDTAHRAIGEVAVVASSGKYQYGAHVEQFDSAQMSRINHASLATLMQTMSGVYVKRDVSGLATVNVRGTGANHTAVLIDGINVNSLTLGHANLSAVPLWLFDEVSLQYGGASALVGSDAIGGVINLNNKTVWNSGFKVQTKLERGSTNHGFYGSKVQWSGSKLTANVRGFYTHCKNNFVFANTAAKNMMTHVVPLDTQRNAAYNNWGVLGQLAYRIAQQTEANVKYIYTFNKHQIQPNMSDNFYGGARDSLSDSYTLLMANIKHRIANLSLSYTSALAHANQLYYSGDSPSRIATTQFINGLNGEYQYRENTSVKFGANTTYIKPNVYAYSDNLHETRIEPFVSVSQRLWQVLRLSLNARSSAVTGYQMPFAPSLGLELVAYSNDHSKLTVRASGARSFKIPTFNQRFWAKVGNPNLKPEYSLGGDAGLSYAYCSSKHRLQTSATVYYLDIDNLIQWVQMGDWRPVNVQKVQSYGMEYSIKDEYQIGKIALRAGLQYAYNAATILRDDVLPQREGKLLSYSPQHLATANGGIGYKQWQWWFAVSYTDLRYTEDRAQLPSYTLFSTQLNYEITVKKHHVAIYSTIDNLFDVEYQNQKGYPNGRRFWRAGIQYFL